jgi:protein involved in polysaccharide export with SLBB domain
MKRFLWLGAGLVSIFLSGCAGSGSTSSSQSVSPAAMPREADTIRVGDKITVRLTGVPEGSEYFNEIQIPASGDVTVPLLAQPFHAAGKTPAQVAGEIGDAYKSQRIYTTPNVIVLPEERFVSVGGDLRSPTRVLFTADMTVMSAINSCGGFDEYANKRSVRLIRGSQIIYVDCVKAASAPGADPAVYPGDQIWVPRTVF